MKASIWCYVEFNKTFTRYESLLKDIHLKLQYNNDTYNYHLAVKNSLHVLYATKYQVGDHSFSTFPKFPEKLAFLTPDTHKYVLIRG